MAESVIQIIPTPPSLHSYVVWVIDAWFIVRLFIEKKESIYTIKNLDFPALFRKQQGRSSLFSTGESILAAYKVMNLAILLFSALMSSWSTQMD
jgi:hypothetical protein